MGISATTISFHVLVDIAERNARRNLRKNRIGFGTDDYSIETLNIAPQTSRTLYIPANFLYLFSNADKGKLSVTLTKTSGSFTTGLNNILFLSDFTGITAITIANNALIGTPSLCINIIKG